MLINIMDLGEQYKSYRLGRLFYSVDLRDVDCMDLGGYVDPMDL